MTAIAVDIAQPWGTQGAVQVVNQALDLTKNEEPFTLPNSPSGPLAVLAFKLEEGKYGQLTYVRVYSGTLQKGTVITNQSSGKRQKVPRLVRTHADEIQDTAEVKVIPSLLCGLVSDEARMSHSEYLSLHSEFLLLQET
jgi:translation elongation factor EF-G